ncbi:MAG: hypothetical protein Kow0059_18170 [Candidatus Sumerlaeia bacterium]
MKRLLIWCIPAMALAALNQPAGIRAQTAADGVSGIASLQDLTAFEISNMVQAELLAFLDTGFYTTLENLDDLPYETQNNLFDWIHEGGGALVIDVRTGTFKPGRENLLDLPNRWQGGYINAYHPSRISLDGAGYDRGTPLDFWGTPYLLFSPLGLLRPQTQSVTLEYYGDSFDRYAIVSFGPDRVMSGDDVIQTFGSAPTRTIISSVTLVNNPTSGTLMRIKGYNFGSQGVGAVVRVNGEPKNDMVCFWSPQEIHLDLTTGRIAQAGAVEIVVPGGDVSPPYPYSLPPFLRAYDWELYR